MTTFELVRLQETLEGLRRDGKGDLVRDKEMPGESGHPTHLKYVIGPEYAERVFGAHLPEAVRSELPAKWESPLSVEITRILARAVGRVTFRAYRTHIPKLPVIGEAGAGTYRTKDSVLKSIGNGFSESPYPDVYAVIEDGRAVSAAVSAREDERSAELWVFTLPDFRGRGYARKCAADWFNAKLREGRIPFYSYDASNFASAALCASLGLEFRFESLQWE